MRLKPGEGAEADGEKSRAGGRRGADGPAPATAALQTLCGEHACHSSVKPFLSKVGRWEETKGAQ